MTDIKENIRIDFEKLRSNKDEYLDVFYKNNYGTVYKICYSILKNKENSEDVAQGVFEKIMKLDYEKLPTEHEASWLYTVSKNECFQHLRKKNIDSSEEDFENVENNKNEIDEYINNESFNRIIKKLDKKQEQIVQLKIASEFTFKEIGQMLSMPTATVQWYYYSSMKSLKIALSNMAIFIISLVMGIRYIAKEDVDNKVKERNTNKFTDAGMQDSEQAMESSKTSNNIISSSENIETQEYTVHDVSNNNNAPRGKNYGIFAVPALFLVLSIIFFILFRRNCKRKK